MALSAICAGRTNTRRQRICYAVLAEELDPHDLETVSVSINGRLVGHLPLSDVKTCKRHLRRRRYEGRRVLVGAVIIVDPDADARSLGGFVVKLDMSMPPDIVEI